MLRKICRLTAEFAPDWLVGFACGASVLIALESGYEGAWYKLSTIVHAPQSAAPAFGYRILLPFLAAQLERLRPTLTDHNAFIAVQAAAIAAGVYLSGRWASLFLPRFGRPLGYALFALTVAPTIGYWTFYDIAIVGFWTACLLLLHRDRRIAYLAVLALATLNHENVLLLVPCAVLYNWGRMRLSRLALFAAANVAVWAGVRWLTTSLLPGARAFDFRLWENLVFWRHYSMQSLFFAWAVLLPWWGMALLGWKGAPRLLRCSALSLPGLLLVTTLFGRYEEARQFVAFIPTCIGLIACWLRVQTGGAGVPPEALNQRIDLACVSE
jgi:hypothetical protein